ncbi:MAG: XRE family transcriptional regulator, partial [Shewanella oncorhynchi]
MVKINQQILKWARERRGLTLSEAAKKLGWKESRLQDLEITLGDVTQRQAMQISEKYHCSLLTLYLGVIPKPEDKGQDFRKTTAVQTKDNALLDILLTDIKTRQALTRSIMEDDPDFDSVSFIGSLKPFKGIMETVVAIKNHLNLDEKNPKDLFAYLRDRVESLGIFVILSGDIGSYHTKINADVFRGFALSDDLAPFIVINSYDAPITRPFTLIHELVHLGFGHTGVSATVGDDNPPIEQFCNDVAGEFLLPKSHLLHLQNCDDLDKIKEFAQQKNVSASMVAYRLKRNGMIDQHTWGKLSDALNSEFKPQKTGGPNHYTTKKSYNGKALMGLVQYALSNGILSPTK